MSNTNPPKSERLLDAMLAWLADPTPIQQLATRVSYSYPAMLRAFNAHCPHWKKILAWREINPGQPVPTKYLPLWVK